MTRAALAALALTTPPLLLGGCGNTEAQDAQVRLVNATTEYATLDLYTVNSKNESNLFITGTPSYGASGYEGLFEGSYTFRIVGSGASAAASETTGSVTKTDHFAVVTYLTGQSVTTQVLSEEEDAPSSGNAKLRILNGATQDVGPVDVYVTSHDCSALTNTDTAFASSVSNLQSSFGEIITTSSGSTWNLCVTRAGTKTDLRLAANAVTFSNQQVSTLILTHTGGGTLLNGMLLNQQGTLTKFVNSAARLRLVADAANHSTVSATVNGVTFATNLISPVVGTYKNIPSGALTMNLAIDGNSVGSSQLTAAAGGDYTLVVAGTAGDSQVKLLTDDNTPSISTDLPVKMRLVNFLNGLVEPAALSAAGAPVGEPVTFGQATTYEALAAADASADIVVTAASLNIFELDAQSLLNGAVYTVFLIGDSTQVVGDKGKVVQDRPAIPVQPPASSASN